MASVVGKISIDTSGIERCGVGAKIYDSFHVIKVNEDREAFPKPKLWKPDADSHAVIISKSEFIKWIKIINPDFWEGEIPDVIIGE